MLTRRNSNSSFVFSCFLNRRDAYKKVQLKRGRFKVPRAWIEQERLAKIEKRKRFKRQMKEQIKQKHAIKDKQNGDLDMEMNNLHRTRPQIPGSWRRGNTIV